MLEKGKIRIIKELKTKNQLKELNQERFNYLAKVIVNIERKIIAIDGDLHSDGKVLLEADSKQENVWSINIYHDFSRDQWIKFGSIINIRRNHNNLSRFIKDENIRKKITGVVNKFRINE